MSSQGKPSSFKHPKPSTRAAVTDKFKPLEIVDKYLRDRASSYAAAKLEGSRLLSPMEMQQRGFKKQFADFAVTFPCLDPTDGSLLSEGRVRYLREVLDDDGKTRKFNASYGMEPQPYIAHKSHGDWSKTCANVKTPIWITEGEVRALALAPHGLHVIALGGVDAGFVKGSKRGKLIPWFDKIKWPSRKVYITFDADSRSKDKTVGVSQHQLAVLLAERGAEVHVVPLYPLFKSNDGLDDWTANGALPAYLRMCEKSSLFSAETETQASTLDQPVLRCLSDIEQREVDWLSKPRLPKGMLVGLEGDPGGGKTFIAMKAAAELSRGRDPFTGMKLGKPLVTVYMSIENDHSITTKARFSAMGGDENYFYVLDGKCDAEGKTLPVTLEDIAAIDRAIAETGAALVVIDPLQSYMGAKVDSHKANETRPLLDGLAQIAARRNVCIWIVRHLAKGSGNRAIHRGLGSIDISGAMRSVLMVGTAPDNSQDRAMVQTKSNIGPIAESLAFVIEGKDEHTKLVWKGKSKLTAADFSAPEGPTRKSKLDMAIDYLFEQLQHGPKPAKELEGLYDARTLQRAAIKIGVVRSGHGGKGGAWIWELPQMKFTKKGVGGKTTS